jgi:hypothetical protein
MTRSEATAAVIEAARVYVDSCNSLGRYDAEARHRLFGALAYLDSLPSDTEGGRAPANVGGQPEAVQALLDCALYDATMEGPAFKGWNRSSLDRLRKRYEQMVAPPAPTDDAGAGGDGPNMTAETAEMRRRLRAKIDEQDQERGRPLTDRERLDNLRAALAEGGILAREDDDDPPAGSTPSGPRESGDADALALLRGIFEGGCKEPCAMPPCACADKIAAHGRAAAGRMRERFLKAARGVLADNMLQNKIYEDLARALDPGPTT